MLFAFSRDDGIPGISKALSKVDAKHRSPVNAIWAGSGVGRAVRVVHLRHRHRGHAGLLDRRVVHTVIFLFLSFTVPIALALFTLRNVEVPGARDPGTWAAPLFRIVVRAVDHRHGHHHLRRHPAAE